MCTTIILGESEVNVVIDALTKKMGSINSAKIISGVTTEKMEQEYKTCEKALGVMIAAKENLNVVKTMASETWFAHK